MVLKSVPCAVAAAVAFVLAWGGIACADDYKPSEYLGLDLSKAVLSPKRLGPETRFAPVALGLNQPSADPSLPRLRPDVHSPQQALVGVLRTVLNREPSHPKQLRPAEGAEHGRITVNVGGGGGRADFLLPKD